MVGIGPHIDVKGLQFRIKDRLAGIESAVAREDIAHPADQGKAQKPLRSKQLYRQKCGGHRAVGNAAKDRCQPQGGGKAR